MKRVGLVKTCMVGALLSGVVWAAPGMQARAADIPLKAPAADESPALWWFRGEVEAGGRFFLNDPQRNGSSYLGQKSLAKFYEYSDRRPGPFSNFWLSTGSGNGLYQIDLGGLNVGYDDQYFYLSASKAGEHYFNFIWDQTPHLYSTSAQTIFSGVGSNTLTTPCNTGANALATGSLAAQGGKINPCLSQTDIGIRRDTAAADYRWTPSDPWDIRADYSHMHRYGTQVDGIIGLGSDSPGGNPVELPKPVDDVTQNYGLNGEYAGTSPWGKAVTFKLAYAGSQYTDSFTSYTAQSPFTGGADAVARMSTWPSNNANGFGGTLAADLPWKSHYVGNVNYTMMRQDDAFIPMTNSPVAPVGVNPIVATTLPASSLNGAINTTLINNVLTTKLTPELTSKVNYRYYNFDNQTPELLFPLWVSTDQNPNTSTKEGSIRSLSISYIKQNAGADLNWRPTKEWNFGVAYGFERYNWVRADADATNENSGKVYADWKPAAWLGVRSSGYYADRRYNNYDYVNFVANVQQPVVTGVCSPSPCASLSNSWKYSPAFQQFMLDNRQRWKANVAVDVVVLPGVTLSPNFKYQDDYYGINPLLQTGVDDSRSWAGGIDAVYVLNPDTSFMVGVTREYYTLLLFSGSSFTAPAATNMTNDRQIVDTLTAAVRYAAIPSKLDTELRYTLTHGVDTMQLNTTTGTNPGFPDNTTWWQRFDATAIYTFDKTQVAAMGWKGEVKAKLHYVWERNSVANWATDSLAPFNNIGQTSALYMAGDNPNYNVHQMMASLLFKW